MENKKGQVAIFVIIATVIVASILLFFFLRRAPVGVGEASSNPEQYIEQCVGPSINEVVDIILPQGGFRVPTSYVIYDRTIRVEYLCKNDDLRSNCINIHPMFISEISEEIKSYISPIVVSCFESLESELEKRQASVEMDNATNISVLMTLGKVFVTIDKKVKITEKENTRTFEKFEFDVASPIYNLASVAIDVANEERLNCYFEDFGYMERDTNVRVTRQWMSGSTSSVYTIKDEESGKIMNIAIRSCALTP